MIKTCNNKNLYPYIYIYLQPVSYWSRSQHIKPKQPICTRLNVTSTKHESNMKRSNLKLYMTEQNVEINKLKMRIYFIQWSCFWFDGLLVLCGT